MTLGEKVKALREARGWSQAELARRRGSAKRCSQSWNPAEREDTTGSVLRRLARALYISVDYLPVRITAPWTLTYAQKRAKLGRHDPSSSNHPPGEHGL